jgi:hypothetical protein
MGQKRQGNPSDGVEVTAAALLRWWLWRSGAPVRTLRIRARAWASVRLGEVKTWMNWNQGIPTKAGHGSGSHGGTPRSVGEDDGALANSVRIGGTNWWNGVARRWRSSSYDELEWGRTKTTNCGGEPRWARRRSEGKRWRRCSTTVDKDAGVGSRCPAPACALASEASACPKERKRWRAVIGERRWKMLDVHLLTVIETALFQCFNPMLPLLLYPFSPISKMFQEKLQIPKLLQNSWTSFLLKNPGSKDDPIRRSRERWEWNNMFQDMKHHVSQGFESKMYTSHNWWYLYIYIGSTHITKTMQ